jgi:hypothetical protein
MWRRRAAAVRDEHAIEPALDFTGAAWPAWAFMRIVELREKTVSIASPITNAYIDFSKMTCSIVALITDVVWAGIVDARTFLPASHGG